MKRVLVQLSDNRATNLVVVGEEYEPPEGFVAVDPAGTGFLKIGDIWDGASFSRSPEYEREVAREEDERRQEERAVQKANGLDAIVLFVRPLIEASVRDDSIDDDLLTLAPAILKSWRVGESLAIGDIREYEGVVYEVIRAHTSQDDGRPDIVPALYKEHRPSGEVTEWVQPVDDHRAYRLGEPVTHNGQVWRSTVDYNVWEPGVFGWEPVE